HDRQINSQLKIANLHNPLRIINVSLLRPTNLRRLNSLNLSHSSGDLSSHGGNQKMKPRRAERGAGSPPSKQRPAPKHQLPARAAAAGSSVMIVISSITSTVNV